MIVIKVPGAVYNEFIDGSGVPGEESWPTPTVRLCGRGRQYIYACTEDQLDQITSHIRDCAEGQATGCDPECMQAARRALRWLERR
jgi:uncharacterized protein YecE (DUF72 family)